MPEIYTHARQFSTKDACTCAAQSAKTLIMAPKVLFRWLAWLLICIIIVVTLAPIQFRPTTAAPVSLERFAAFAMIGTLFCLGYPKHRLPILILLLVFVGLLEGAQNLVPGRHGRLPDSLEKVSGALLGAALAVFMTRRKQAP